MAEITRREFLTLSLKGGAGALAQACPLFQGDPAPESTDAAGPGEARGDASLPTAHSASSGEGPSAPSPPDRIPKDLQPSSLL